MIRELSLYFVDRISSLIARQDAEVPIPIVEVGAGTGRLSYFLRQSIDRLLPGCAQFHPIDSGEDGIISLAETDILDAAQAMDTYQPSLVICSWMAPKVDLTPIFRGNPSVREYILLGEKACCGKYPETWSAKDGFTAIDLVGIQKHQIGSMDQHMNRDKAMGNISSAVAFRRISL